MVKLREVKGLLYLLTHLSPRVCLDLRKLELSVVGVHLSDLLPGWCAENLKRTERKEIVAFGLRHEFMWKETGSV